MNEPQDHEIMIRYLQNTCSADEKARFEDWLQASAENRRQFYDVRLLWHASRIEHYGSKPQLDKALDTFTRNVQQSRSQRRKRIYMRMARYAAIVVAVLAVSWALLLRNGHKTVPPDLITAAVSQTDSSRLVVLDDGTRVWLNSNSSITYPRKFASKERTVSLEGEAFFDVAHADAHPFIIKTSTVRINVLGTAFNLQAYPGANRAEAVLVSGKIAIADSLGKNLATITPGQMASFENASHRLTVKTVNPELYTGWRNGQIVLVAADLQTIARKLSELYQVELSIAPAVQDATRYNFTFSKRKTLTEVMDMLCFIAPIRYELQEKNVFINRK